MTDLDNAREAWEISVKRTTTEFEFNQFGGGFVDSAISEVAISRNYIFALKSELARVWREKVGKPVQEDKWTPTHTDNGHECMIIREGKKDDSDHRGRPWDRKHCYLVEYANGIRMFTQKSSVHPIKRTYTVTVELSEDDYRADGGLTITCIDKLRDAARAARG